MRIGMVLTKRFPPDIRVEKEASVLKREHQLFMLCPRRGNQKAEEMCNGIHVQRVFSKPGRWWANARLMANCSSVAWKRALHAYAVEHKIDVLHVHDLPLLGDALEVARKLDLPVVADLHENYPEMMAQALHDTRYGRMSAAQLVQRLTVSIDKWRRYERRAVPRADAVIVVIEEARERLIRLGVAPERIHIVANYTPLEDPAVKIDKKHACAADEKFKVVYAGGFVATRELHTVIDAVALLSPAETPGLQVVLIGGHEAAIKALQRYIDKKRVQDRVVLVDWRPLEEVMEHIQSCQVGLAPLVKSPHNDASINHKLFQYMICRRPVIASNCIPMERIVKETGCGLVYPSGDAAALAMCLKRLYVDPEMRDRMGNAGYKAVQDKYNWESTGQTLLQLYRQLASV